MRVALTVVLLAVNAAAQAGGADLIIINANVRTMASAQQRAEAIAVSGGEIIAVGSTRAVQALADESTKVIDAAGKLVLPGFNDAHVHFAAVGNIFSSLPLKEIKTPKELREKLSFFVRFLPKGRWILGSGWDNRSWIPNDPPNRAIVDDITPDNPLLIYNWDASAAFVNSAAMKIAGIDKDTKVPVGGTIIRNADGEPTGVLRGKAIDLVARLVPKDHIRDWPAIIETASNYAASFGITSVQDTHSDDIYDVLRALHKQGKLKTRVYDCISLQSWKKLADARVKAASGDAMVRRGCMKFFAEEDGEDIAELERDVAGADKAGLQIAIHAIGEKPNQTVLDIFEKTIKANGARDRRLRVEHAHHTPVADWPRFARSNIIASMQPWLFYGDNGSGNDDFKKIFGMSTLVAFGSDASMVDLNPIMGVFAAVNGKNAISVEQALRAYTLGSAFAEFQEKVKGTIEVGKLADFVILSDDVFSIDRAKIRNVRAEKTIMNGKVVFESAEN
jgi:predicted amidohydrolase YtcJ